MGDGRNSGKGCNKGGDWNNCTVFEGPTLASCYGAGPLEQ